MPVLQGGVNMAETWNLVDMMCPFCMIPKVMQNKDCPTSFSCEYCDHYWGSFTSHKTFTVEPKSEIVH